VTLISVPEKFAADTVAREGKAARLWLARLPELVDELSVRWGLRVAGDPMHGYLENGAGLAATRSANMAELRARLSHT